MLASWSGQGALWDGLAAVEDELDVLRQWNATDAQRRAHRVLFAKLEPRLRRWPTRISTWIDALPAESSKNRYLGLSVSSATSWPETRIHYGWPPKGFVAHLKDRIPDTLLSTTLRWTLDFLELVRRDAVALDPTITRSVQAQLDGALALLTIEPLMHSAPLLPTRTDVDAFAREGWPWNVVAPVTEYLRGLAQSLPALAAELIMPAPELAWRLFHLAVFGTVLVAAEKIKAKLTAVRPLSGTTNGPAYLLDTNDGQRWDLWFEAAGAWSYYGGDTIYKPFAQGLREAPRPLSPDILLIRRGRALVIECKYSANPDVVGRSGALQALGYTSELRQTLCEHVKAVVVGPSGVVKHATSVDHRLGTIALAAPDDLAGIISDWVSASC